MKTIREILVIMMLLALLTGAVAFFAMAIGNAVRDDEADTICCSFASVALMVVAIKFADLNLKK